MTYRVVLITTEEGVAALCPALPGCASQGTTEADAVENVREAMTLWLEAGGIPRAEGGTAAERGMLQEAAADSLKVSVRDLTLAVAV